jgi:hypothetical protein
LSVRLRTLRARDWVDRESRSEQAADLGARRDDVAAAGGAGCTSTRTGTGIAAAAGRTEDVSDLVPRHGSRKVLRQIAFDERLTISDLIREGLNLVLAARGYPSIDELRRKATDKD